MKKTLLIALLASVTSLSAWAQAPQKFNYQGVARDNTGKSLDNKTIGLRISILDGSSTGTAQYVETQSATTNQFGLYSLQVGGGTVVSGTMSGVTWSSGSKYMKVEIDPNGGSAYTDLGAGQLLSVPYALYAAAPAGPAGPQGPQGPQGVQGPAGSANMSGTSGYHVKFNTSTSGNNSALYETSSGLIGMGTTSPTSDIHVSTADSMQLRASSTYSSQVSFGIIRAEYTGTTDANHAAMIGVAIPNTSNANGTGVLGAGGFFGVEGRAFSASTSSSISNAGLKGTSYLDGGSGYGVIGLATSYTTSGGTKYGVYGNATNGTTNYAGYFLGNVQVVGTLAKSGGTFKIDHPLDPDNKYLYHSFVESPDMMNVYNGNITTDSKGYATVELPTYFEALNKDFRYQLTVIGTFAQAIVKQKVAGNKFVIQTNQPNVEVSWQVTGIRQDAFAKAHPVIPEVEKEAENKGKYLNPAELGKSPDLQIGKYVDNNTNEIPNSTLINKK